MQCGRQFQKAAEKKVLGGCRFGRNYRWETDLKVSADVPDARCIRHRECRAIAPEYTQAERTPRLAGCGASP